MQIKEMPLQERPQEKLMYFGADALTISELLAIIIRTGNKDKSSIQLAEELLGYIHDNDLDLGNAMVEELTKVSGIGLSKACAVVAAIELSRRIKNMPSVDKRAINCPKDVWELIGDDLRHEKREHLIVLLLNVKSQVEARITISIGELSATVVHPREVFSPAIRKGAAAIIVIHNHPSGDPSPSREDIDATNRLIKAGQIIGIKVVDHIIIGEKSWYSLKQAGVVD